MIRELCDVIVWGIMGYLDMVFAKHNNKKGPILYIVPIHFIIYLTIVSTSHS